jgi:20S proteasome alpha/beta subunit
VTICIAAICEVPNRGPVIIGASDRKVTAGDIQFEPETQKLYPFSDYIVALVAGDLAAQKEICDYTFYNRPQTVQETVRMYCQQIGCYNNRQAEQVVLAPLGMTMQNFLDNQRRMSPEFVNRVANEMARESAGIETIICGIDNVGTHLYSIDAAGRYFCNTAIGFAAIGDGANHAQSQFMFARYTPRWVLSRAMQLMYTAKKRAEVAPGVGLQTDLFFIADRGRANFYPPLTEGLEQAYKILTEAQDRAVEESNQALEKFMDKMVQEQPSEQQRGPEIETPPPPEQTPGQPPNPPDASSRDADQPPPTEVA